MSEKSNDSPGTMEQESQQELLSSFVSEIIKSPVNLLLVGVITLLVYKIVKSKTKPEEQIQEVKRLPKIRRDFTVEELKKYDGNGPDGRILLAVNGKVFDVTLGARYYGPGGPYQALGGHDASRALATFTVQAVKDVYDDLSDLNSSEMSSVREWEAQIKEKYDYVGILLRPGQAPTNYSDEEDEGSQQESEAKLEQQEAKSNQNETAEVKKDV